MRPPAHLAYASLYSIESGRSSIGPLCIRASPGGLHARRTLRPREPRRRSRRDGEPQLAWDFDAFLALDEERRELIGEVEALQAQRNEASKAIGELMKDGKRDEAEARQGRGPRASTTRSPRSRRTSTRSTPTLRDLLLTVPNIPDASVPVGADETDNVEVRRWGTPPRVRLRAARRTGTSAPRSASSTSSAP